MAILKYTEAMNIRKEILGEEHPAYATSLNNIAYVYKKKGEYNKALDLYLKVIEIRKKALGKDHPNYTASLDNLVIHYHETNEIDKSISILIQSLKINQKNIHEKLNALSEDYMIKWIQKNRYLFNLSHSILLNQYSDDLALETYNYLLTTKSLALEKSGENNFLNFTEDNPIAKKLYINYKNKREEYLKVLLMTIKERKSKKLNLEKIKREINNIEVRLAIESKSIKNKLDNYKKEIAFRDVVGELKSDEAILDFNDFKYHNGIESRDSILYTAYLILPKSKYPIFIPLVEEKEIQILLNESIGSQNGMSYIESQERGEELYKLIFTPLEKHLKGIKTIHISSSGILYKVAFHALKKEGSLLVDNYDIHYHGTMRGFIIQRMRKEDIKVKNKNIALFGNPDFNAFLEEVEIQEMNGTDSIWATRGNRDGFNPLPETKKEVESIEKYAKEKEWMTNTRVGMLANEANFKSLSGKKINIIHIATHGYFLEQNKKIKNDQLLISNQERITR
jgi:hypothetical protein